MLSHKGTQPLETPRLILRKACREDAEPMFRNWASDPEVTKYLTWQPHEKIEVTQTLLEGWVAEYERNDYYHWISAGNHRWSCPVRPHRLLYRKKLVAPGYYAGSVAPGYGFSV